MLDGEKINPKVNKTFNYEEYSFQFISYGSTERTTSLSSEIKRVNGTEILDDALCIHFSNTLNLNDFPPTSKEEENYFDISISGILQEKNKESRAETTAIMYEGQPKHLQIVDTRFKRSLIDEVNLSELKSRMLYLNNEFNRRLLKKYISYPQQLIISLDFIQSRKKSVPLILAIDEPLLRFEKEASSLNSIENEIYDKLRKFADKNETWDLQNLAKSAFLLRVADAYFTDVENSLYYVDNKENVKKLIDNLNALELRDLSVQDLLNKFRENVIKCDGLGRLKEFERDSFNELTDSYLQFINFFINDFVKSNHVTFTPVYLDSIELHKDGSRSFGYGRGARCKVKLVDQGIQLINKLIASYQKISTKSAFLDFEWRGMSSGEETLFSMLARFNTLKDKVKGKSIVILIDEGELTLHPEWQRRYLDILIDFTQNIYKEAKNIQIICTTHSPFIVSDLPKEKVVFLERQEDGKCKVVEESDSEQTFAANIHELMVEGFFMESTTGEFAKGKIKYLISLIEELNEKILFENNNMVKEIEKMINLIAEPILRSRIESLFEDKKNKCLSEKNNREKLIEFYQREIDRLKKERDYDD